MAMNSAGSFAHNWADRQCHESAHEQASEWMQKAFDLKAENDRLRAAVLDIDAHATPYGEDEDGWTTHYLMGTGALHRALGVIGHGAPKCRACPHAHDPYGPDGFVQQYRCKHGTVVADRNEYGTWTAHPCAACQGGK